MKIINYIIAEILIFAIWIDNAHAYIDPAAGSMILQALLAALIGIGVFVRQCRMKIMSFFKGLKNKVAGQNGDE